MATSDFAVTEAAQGVGRRQFMVGGAAALCAAISEARANESKPLPPSDAPVARTKYGLVRGARVDGAQIFKGISYGAPTADRRFMPARPPARWDGVRDALDFGNQAPQLFGRPSGLFTSWWNPRTASEDCLVLNVYTPNLADGKKRAVMFWIHGGLFANGSASANYCDGTRLAQLHDVVVVTVNHRLNAFGYLYLAHLSPALADSGNIGNLDLVHALKWVRDNIANFGGDPGNVTIFGQSGGGMEVVCLLAMPPAQGLFHRAVVQSGSLLTVPTLEQAKESTARVLAAVKLGPQDVDKLRTMPMEQIAAALPHSRAGFWPVVDGRSLRHQPWDPNAPSMSKGVPVMVGHTRTEETGLRGAHDPSTWGLTWDSLHSRLASETLSVDAAETISKLRALMPEANPSEIFFVTISQNSLGRAADIFAERRAAQTIDGAAPVYTYLVNWNTPVDGGKWMSPHALDLAFVFDNAALSTSFIGPETAETRAMASAMSGAWTRFAKTGNPGWAPFSPERRTTMVFDVQSRTVDDPTKSLREIFAEAKGIPDFATPGSSMELAGPQRHDIAT
jgi:para-nitrobenzyl esterase